MVDISVTLVDGQFHSVDSSDMAFKTATSIAMKEGLAAADPVVLEPIDHVVISVPNDFTARAQRLLTGRKGQILGYTEKPGWPGWDDVEALVPEAELHDLIIELRSQTQGLRHICAAVRSPGPAGGWRGRRSRGRRKRRGWGAASQPHQASCDRGRTAYLPYRADGGDLGQDHDNIA